MGDKVTGRVNRRPSRNWIQPPPQETDQARTKEKKETSDLTAASMKHQGHSTQIHNASKARETKTTGLKSKSSRTKKGNITYE
jgi:hypothetical protein